MFERLTTALSAIIPAGLIDQNQYSLQLCFCLSTNLLVN